MPANQLPDWSPPYFGVHDALSSAYRIEAKQMYKAPSWSGMRGGTVKLRTSSMDDQLAQAALTLAFVKRHFAEHNDILGFAVIEAWYVVVDRPQRVPALPFRRRWYEERLEALGRRLMEIMGRPPSYAKAELCRDLEAHRERLREKYSQCTRAKLSYQPDSRERLKRKEAACRKLARVMMHSEHFAKCAAGYEFLLECVRDWAGLRARTWTDMMEAFGRNAAYRWRAKARLWLNEERTLAEKRLDDPMAEAGLLMVTM